MAGMKLPQYSLRSLLVAILLFAIILGQAVEIARLRRINSRAASEKAVAEYEMNRLNIEVTRLLSERSTRETP